MIFGQLGPCGFHGVLIIEGDTQCPLAMFLVVVDADVLDADALGRQNDRKGGNGTDLVHDIHGEGVVRSQCTFGFLGERAPIGAELSNN